MLIKWLHKVFSRILLLEDVPPCMKEGSITPIYKGKFVGVAAHADDLRASKCSVQEQVDIINKFTSSNPLKLNSSKTKYLTAVHLRILSLWLL